jgi:MFS family permease
MDRGAWLGFINAVQSLGAMCCYPAVAWSNNRYGRKKTIAVGYFWLVLGVTVQTTAQSPAMFVVGRLFIGGVSAFFSASVPLLMTETAYPTQRADITSFYNTGWYVGSLLAAWVTYGTRNVDSSWAWRIPSLMQCCLPLVIMPGFLYAPESPRFLISKGRGDEARAFLVKYHGGGDEDSQLAAFEYKEICDTLELERRLKSQTSFRNMFKTKGNLHRSFITITLGVFAQWNGQHFTKRP